MTPKRDFEKWMPGWAVIDTYGAKDQWIVAFQMAAVEGEVPGETILFLKQGPRAWHAFYRERATGSGSTPRAALSGGLGDVISSDAELRGYCKAVLAAPSELASQFAGLYDAQVQCHEETH